ncbi:MAG: ATP-binding protein [Actinomycetota bacterium]
METRKILAADDSPMVLAILSRVLKGEGYELTFAADGIEAVQRAYSDPPDLIFLDIFMPRMNGYQACRLLKNDPVMRDIPIIILSGTESRGDAFWSLETGANEFMQKPFDPQVLLRKAAALLERRSASATRPASQELGPEDILSKVSALMDRELYNATVQRIELKTILNNLSDGIITVGTDGQITAVNPALTRMVGRREADLLGLTCAEALGEPAGSDAFALCVEVLSGEAEQEQDSELRNRDGGVTPVSISAALLHDHLGTPVGCACVLQDITRRKQIEALSRLKDDLTHMIVHDLRTPLTSLIGGLQTMDVLGELNEDQETFLNMAVSGGVSLLEMINDLLDISKMEEGSLRLEHWDVSVDAMVRRCCQQVHHLATQKQLAVNTDLDPSLPALWADGEKLQRTVVNLLGNAIKFTPAGGAVTIKSRHSQTEEGTPAVLISVADTGEGIPREAFARIFEKFGQVENRKAGTRMSTGLGLTFCKMITEAHGGRIWVESEVGKGSTFAFTIPLITPSL